jgi:hypothetical protein
VIELLRIKNIGIKKKFHVYLNQISLNLVKYSMKENNKNFSFENFSLIYFFELIMMENYFKKVKIIYCYLHY